MKIDGECLCGDVAYEAEIDPENVGLCHCTDCQTLSGSAFRIGRAPRRGVGAVGNWLALATATSQA